MNEKPGLSSSQALAGKISLQLPTAPLSNTSPRALRKPEYAINTLFNVLSSEIKPAGSPFPECNALHSYLLANLLLVIHPKSILNFFFIQVLFTKAFNKIYLFFPSRLPVRQLRFVVDCSWNIKAIKKKNYGSLYGTGNSGKDEPVHENEIKCCLIYWCHVGSREKSTKQIDLCTSTSIMTQLRVNKSFIWYKRMYLSKHCSTFIPDLSHYLT